MSREAIDKVNAEFVAAMNNGDVSAAMNVYTENAKLLPPNAPAAQGKANIQAFWEGAGEALGIKSVSLKTVEIEFLGDTAIEHGQYTLEHAAGTDNGKFIIVWKRESDGSWKWYIDIWNSDLAPAG